MKKIKINAEMLVSFAFILLGAVVMKVSCGYGLWNKISPSKGFMPFVSAALMTVCSLWWLIQTVIKSVRGDDGAVRFTLNELKWMLLIPAICFVTVFLMQWIGLYAAIALFLFGWFLLIDKFSPIKSLGLTALLCVIFYLIFSVGLQVPFPKFALF